MNTSVVEQSYWDEAYENLSFQIMGESDEVRIWLEKHIKKTSNGTCLEVGCFPGRYLAVLGILGFELHGIDLTPRIAELKTWLENSGHLTGDFKHEDFLKFHTEDVYDIVCSFGFIEHFTDWKEILKKHASLVKQGGTIIIETPNFKGSLQHLLHKHLDEENYSRHFTAAMQPFVWKDILENLGFEVKWCGYFGKFDFWSDTKHYNKLQIIGLRILSFLKPILAKLPPGRKSYAPYCGIVAEKK